MVSFQCTGVGGVDLCLNNGSCTVLTWEGSGENGSSIISTRNESGCSCPGGLEYDFVFYHFPSCTLPSNAYLGFLIYYSIATLILICLIANESWTIAHGKTRQVAIANVMVLLFTWCQVASVCFQGGAFEGNAVFACISFSITFYMGGKLSISFMETLYAVRRVPVGKFRQVLKMCTVVAIGTSIPCGLAMLGTCRMSNASYNLAAWFMETQLSAWIFIFCGIIAYYTTMLLGNIEHASAIKGSTNEGKRAIRELIRKVRFLRNTALYNAVFILMLGAPKAVAFLVLGSVPYQWVFGYAFLYQGLLVMSCGVLMFVRHTNRKRRRDEQERKNNAERGDGHSSAAGEDSQTRQPGATADGSKRKRRKEHGLHTDGKNGRTWLFRGSSLMTIQNNNKDRTKMTYDHQAQQPPPDIQGSPVLTNGPPRTGSPKTGKSPPTNGSPIIANGAPKNGSPRPRRKLFGSLSKS